MVSNLSTIGFSFADEAGYREAMVRLAEQAAERLTCGDGEYAIWRSRTGAEIWFHLAPEPEDGGARDIVGLTPFFEGHSEIEIEIEDIFQREDDDPLEGAVSAWVAPDDLGIGAYPIVFDAIDHGAIANIELPQVRRARISGFARELRCHADEAAFAAAVETGEEGASRLAAQAFVPLGMFERAAVPHAVNGNGNVASDASGAETDEQADPSSTALINGRVLQHAKLVNEETGQAFHWLLVESLAATYDIVADPQLVTADIAPGCIVETACWLFGRILADA